MTPAWPAGPTATDGTSLEHVREMWLGDPASAALGMEAVEVDRVDGLGRATTRTTVTETMVNGHAIMHGGFQFTLCDSTFALACNTSGAVTVAAGCDIDFIAPARLGDVLVAEGRETARWGRNGITDVTLRREGDGQVICQFRGRSRQLKG